MAGEEPTAPSIYHLSLSGVRMMFSEGVRVEIGIRDGRKIR